MSNVNTDGLPPEMQARLHKLLSKLNLMLLTMLLQLSLC